MNKDEEKTQRGRERNDLNCNLNKKNEFAGDNETARSLKRKENGET